MYPHTTAKTGPNMVLNHFSQPGQSRNRHMWYRPAGRRTYIAAMVTQDRVCHGCTSRAPAVSAITGAILPQAEALTQTERRVIVAEQGRIRADAVEPAQIADVEVEKAARVALGEQDGEPGDELRHASGEADEQEHNVVRDSQQPLHEDQPARELLR